MSIGLQAIRERESSKGGGGFEMKGSQEISIGKAGHLNITFTGNGFVMQEKSEVGNQPHANAYFYAE